MDAAVSGDRTTGGFLVARHQARHTLALSSVLKTVRHRFGNDSLHG